MIASPTRFLDIERSPCEATILVAESSVAVGHQLVEQLRADRYSAALAHTAEHARSLARTRPVRAIVLGTLDAPHEALDLLEEVRWSSSDSIWDEYLPAIILSPGMEQLDLLRAFETGADDVIVRADGVGPDYLELRARLKALLRRAERIQGNRIRVGPLDIDARAHLVRVNDAPVELCRLEYELLIHLARNPSAVCSKQELLREIWHQHGRGSRTVDSHASRLRRKLDAAGAHGLVVNVWGVGYRLT